MNTNERAAGRVAAGRVAAGLRTGSEAWRPPAQYALDMSWSRACTAGGWLVAIAVVAFVAAPRFADEPAVTTVMLGLTLLSLLLASILAWRVPQHPAGALLAGNAVASFAVIAAGDVDDTALAGDWMLLYVFLAELLLVMPTGRLARRGHAAWLGVAIGMPVIAGSFIALNAYAWATGDQSVALIVVSGVLLLAYFSCLVASAVSLGLRYREADAAGRMSLRWMFLAGAAVPLTLALCWASYLVFATPELVIFGLLVMHIAIPVATTIALVRPGWFDVDAAAATAATVSILSFGVLVIVSMINAVAGLLVMSWSPVAGIVTTLIFGALAVPLYRVLHRAIARVMFPGRERALAALHALRRQMESGERAPEELGDVLRSALRDPGLRVAYHRIGDGTPISVTGEPLPIQPGATAAPVNYLGERIGSIVPSAGHGSSLPRAVCAAAGPLLDTVRMRAELREAMRDVAASRERLMLAGYETRRRLERDLHDGAQQRLVALGMRLRVLQRTTVGADGLAETLDGAVAELAIAVAELRQLAHGVRPGALDDGLTSALADLKRRAPHAIDLDADVDDLPDAVATTAYFVASEAIANAIKHADASRIRVVARHHGGVLHLTISDDGRGGAIATGARPEGSTDRHRGGAPVVERGGVASGGVASGGTGLEGLRDRVAVHGGRLSVDSPIGGGTTIEVVIPCGS